MAANLITLGRVLLAVLVIYLFQTNFYGALSAVFLTGLVIYLDSLDGIIARKLKMTSEFGALFDIAGDRIVEHVYWIYFSVIGLVSIWVPIIYISRSFLVDMLRTIAFTKSGQTPFGENSMMRSRLTYWLTASRPSRGIYGAGKVIAFLCLGIIIVLNKADYSIIRLLPENFMYYFSFSTQVLVWIVVLLNLIRGLPVLWDGREYLFANNLPRKLENAGRKK